MKNIIMAVLKSIFVTFSISFDVYSLYNKDFYNLFSIDYIFIFLLFLVFLYIFYRDNKKSNYIINILSVIFSIFMIFGYSYMKIENANLVFGHILLFFISIVKGVSYYIIFNYFLKLLFNFIDNYKNADYLGKNKFIVLFLNHPFAVSLIIILICWLPYIISFYPAILSPDPSFQIRQFFGIWTKYNEYSVMLDNSVLITNHHPVIHTLFLGGGLKLGRLLGSDNFGLFICSLVQILFLASTLSYTIKYLKDIGINYKYLIVCLVIYSLVPMFPFYSMSLVKDVIFTCFTILFLIYIHKIIQFKLSGFRDYFSFLLIMIGMVLFRNNGIHVILLTFVFMFILLKEFRKRCLLLVVIVLSLSMCYNKIVLPYFKITPSSIREVLSIPFQQTARYVKYYGDDLTNKEVEVIDNIFDISDLSERYNPELSDPVKGKYNRYATKDDLSNYFEVWFNCFIRHPNVYLDGTINNIYGYFYPNKTNWYIYCSFDDRITKNGFDYHFNSLSIPRYILSGYGGAFPSIPGIGMISNIGFNVWLMFIIIGYIIFNKNYKGILILIPGFALLLVCVASPANCYFRYAMPFIFAMPLVIGFLFSFVKRGEV